MLEVGAGWRSMRSAAGRRGGCSAGLRSRSQTSPQTQREN